MATEYLKDFILSHSNWEELLTSSPYNLKINRWKNFIFFKYNQLESDFSIPLVREARGIGFEEATWKCVCRAFDKFGNYGESYCPDIDWETASVQEKVDGSLIRIFNYNGVWEISTNSGLDAHNAPTGNALYPTFADLFSEAFAKRGISILNTDYTYMFELVSPYNRVVVPYDSIDLYLLGARDMRTLEEIDPEILGSKKFPKRYPLKTLDEVQVAANAMDWDSEGFVVCDSHFNRVKIKSPAWLLAHHTVNNGAITVKQLIEVVRQGEQDEFTIYAPEYKDLIGRIEDCVVKFNGEVDKEIANIEQLNFDSQKDFAIYVKSLPIDRSIKAMLFSYKSGRPHHFFDGIKTAQSRIDIVNNYLEVK